MKLEFNKNILITAGPTIEDIDPVRYITNRSSGKMGIALTKQALKMGANVTLIHGPLQVKIPKDEHLFSIYTRSAQEMLDVVLKHINYKDVAIFTAAVCDYKPEQIATQKLKKDDSDNCPFTNIKWVKNPDILATVGNLDSHPFLVGFAAESENIIEYGRNKLQTKKCDLICANDISNKDKGFEVDKNQVILITKDKEITLPLLSKDATAKRILNFIRKTFL